MRIRRRTWAWIAGGFGLAAWLHRRSKRRTAEEALPAPYAPEQAVPAEAGPDPRAEELRARLDEAKAAGDDRDEFEAAETPVDADPDPDTRRRGVHDEARAAIEEMTGPADGTS